MAFFCLNKIKGNENNAPDRRQSATLTFQLKYAEMYNTTARLYNSK